MIRIIFISFFLFSSNLHSAELKPLMDVLEKRDMNDHTTILYTLQRCAGLYATGWDHLLDQNPEGAEGLKYLSTKFRAHATRFVKGAENISQDKLFNDIHEGSLKFQTLYTDLFSKNWIENGAYFEGTWIEGDLLVCNDINNYLEDF